MTNKDKIKKEKNLIYKSKTPKKITRLVILFILDSIALTGMIVALILVVNILIYIGFPDLLFPSIIYGLGMICMGFISYSILMLILLEFFTYLWIYENGIEIFMITLLPLKFKRKYISYDSIIDVKIEIDDFNLETLYIYVKDREPYQLDEFEITDLQKAMNNIMGKIKNKK